MNKSLTKKQAIVSLGKQKLTLFIRTCLLLKLSLKFLRKIKAIAQVLVEQRKNFHTYHLRDRPVRHENQFQE